MTTPPASRFLPLFLRIMMKAVMPDRRGKQHPGLQGTGASELERVDHEDLLEARDGVVLEEQRAVSPSREQHGPVRVEDVAEHVGETAVALDRIHAGRRPIREELRALGLLQIVVPPMRDVISVELRERELEEVEILVLDDLRGTIQQVWPHGPEAVLA